MNKIKVAIVFGGCSPEYEVSLQSAYSVIKHMDSQKYETILIGITQMGKWLRYNGDIENIMNNTWFSDKDNCIPACISPDRENHGIMEWSNGSMKSVRIDMVFPVLHGKNGEDGTLQGLISLAGIPLAGCGTLSSALCMDKDKAHKLAGLAGIKVPDSVLLTKSDLWEKIFEKTEKLKRPIFVKPLNAGSSYGISKVDEKGGFREAVEKAFQYDDQIIIEEGIEGFEVGCAVLGNQELLIGEVDEIQLGEGFFDYKEKYSLATSKIYMPARISGELAKKVKDTAALIYRALGCQGFARVDMFITPEEEIFFNEVNTIPGFTSHSRYPNMMKGIGLGFAEIIDKIIQLGFEK